MTSTEPPASREPDDPQTPDSGQRYNLAARVYDDANGDIPPAGANGDALPASADSDIPPGNDTRDGAERYNLAARVYDDANGDIPPTSASDDSPAGSANGDTAGGARAGDGADGSTDGDGAERYNLADRVHADGAPGRGPATAVAPPSAPAAAAVAPPRRPGPPAAPERAAGGPPQGRRFSLRTFDSLRVRGFRWYLLAQVGTFGAMNMQMLVNGYLVFTLTGSFAALGTVALARSIPGLVLSMVGGVLADRLPRKYLVQAGQFMSAMIAIGVGLLLLFDMLRFEHLLVSSFLQGGTMAIMMPARQAMLPALVGMDRLQNASALGMGVMNIMRMFGPALGGFMLAATGGEYVYFLMAGLYLYSVLIYIRVPNTKNISAPDGQPGPAMRPQGSVRGGAMGGGPMGGRGMGGRPRGTGAGAVRDLIEGFKYVVRDPTIGMLLAVNLTIVLVSMPYMMLLPGFVIEVLKGGPQTLGYLQSIAAVGSLFGIFVIASMPSRHRGRVMLFGALLMGVALVGFSISTVVLITAPIMVVISIGQTFRMSLSSVLIQTYVDDAYRGRVMSLFMMEMNLVSFATFITGMLAAMFGAQLALGGMAAILVVLSLGILIFVPRLRNLD